MAASFGTDNRSTYARFCRWIKPSKIKGSKFKRSDCNRWQSAKVPNRASANRRDLLLEIGKARGTT